MKDIFVGIMALLLGASFYIKIQGTQAESKEEVEAIQNNLERFAEAGALIDYCLSLPEKAVSDNVRKNLGEYKRELSKAAVRMPDISPIAGISNESSYNRYVDEVSTGINYIKILESEFDGECGNKVVEKTENYSSAANELASSLMEDKSHSVFMYFLRKVFS